MELTLDNAKSMISNVSEKVSELQDRFLNSFVGKTMDTLVDATLQAVLPDAIENQVIDIKDAFLENGISDGVNQIVETIKDFGKSALGIVTGNFENTSQLGLAVKDGGIIPTISKIFDSVVDKVKEKGIINSSTAKTIKEVKNIILNATKKDLSNELKEQEKYAEKLELYSGNWKEAFEEQDFNAMEKAYKKVEEYMGKVMPTEENYKEGQVIENLHNLIKNNGGNFDLSEEELKLAESLY